MDFRTLLPTLRTLPDLRWRFRVSIGVFLGTGVLMGLYLLLGDRIKVISGDFTIGALIFSFFGSLILAII